MKRVVFIIIIASCFILSRGQDNVFDAVVDAPGTLEEVIGDKWQTIDSLVVYGPVNSSDFDIIYKCISEGGVSVLNLEHTQFENNKLPDYAFFKDDYNSLHIGRLMLPKNLVEIGNNALMFAQIDNINIPESIRKIGLWAFAYSNFYIPTFIVPEGVEAIPGNCFRSVSGIDKVVLPSTVKTIADVSFYQSDIQEVSFPDGLDSIGMIAFAGSGIQKAILPPSCTQLGYEAFGSCYDLQELSLTGNIKMLPTSFARNCFMLEQVTLPSSLVRLEDEAFSCCYSLTSINLPNSVCHLGKLAFSHCPLDSLVLPASLATISEHCFAGCDKVSKIYSPSVLPAQCDPSGVGFESMNCDIPVYIPIGSLDMYKNAECWKYFTNFIETDQFPSANVSVATRDDLVKSYVYWVGSSLMIEAQRSVNYAVYTPNGQLVKTGIVGDTPIALSLPRNVYIVQIGGTIHKVL